MSPPKEEERKEIADVETDQVGDLILSPPPMKHSDTRDSISSIDSDISLTYDGNGEPIPVAPVSGDDEGAHLADQSDCGSDTGSTTGKDSGCEITDKPQELPFVPPDDELANRIVSQVEFYFSDVNITKDAFLLKHVKRNKEGFVSLKLISSFKRVKHLAKDWRVVASALARSTKLQINEAGTKLRRLAPLPQYDETTPSRTVVAMHLPHDKPTIESVAELFSCYGEIALVRILRPGNPVPADVRNFVAKRPELDGIVCALVEFVHAESAERAVQSPDRNWKGHSLGIKVVELNAPERVKKRSMPSKKTALARFFESEYSSSCASGSEAEQETRQRHRLRRCSSSSSGPSSPGTPPSNWMQRRLAYNRDSGSESSSSSLYGRSRCNSVVSDAGSCSPYVRSRCNSGVSDIHRPRCNSGVSDIHRARCNSGVSDSNRPRSNSGASHLPDNVVRLPRGPDGTRGFHCGYREQIAAILTVG
jgi:la-related protein 6